MTETLHIRLLGDFSAMLGENPLDTFHKPRLQALLAYLVLHRGAPQFRYHLANLLWPDSAETQAYTNLRNLVYLLRRSLPDPETFLRADSQTLRWVENAPYTLDVLDFSRALGVGAEQDAASGDLDCLEKAVRCYGGDLLPSCYDSWIITERGRLRQQFLTALDELAACLEAQRRYPDAIRYNRRLVEADPLHPGGYPRLMRLLALNGEQPAALKAYRDYARVLRKELGIEPDAEMQTLYLHLKDRAGRLPAAGVQPAAAGKPAALPREFPGEPGDLLPLVGRYAEWQAMQALWKAASGGAPRMLWLRGEAGIGKTRLAEEMVLWAARQGIHTRVARSYPSEGRLPYAPVISWLRAQSLPPLEKIWLVELSRLLPELSKEKPAPLTEAWQRLRLFEGMARAILGNRQRMILLIEDLQWCDQDTLEWLHYLLRFDARARLLLVGTVRSEEEDANPALARLRSALQQEGFSLELEPGRLDEAETGHLAALVSGKALSPGVGPLLYQETEGNPLFIVETIRAEMNKQAHLPGVQPLPYKARAVLQNRIGQLSPGARELVNLAATIGREFSLQVLRQASVAGEEALIQSLDEMLHRRIAREIAADTFDFSHAKLREAALVGVSSAHRQLLHRQVADALVSLAHNSLESKNGEIARHYEEAGQVRLAVQYYQVAAESAKNIFANDIAIQYYQRALALHEAALPNALAPILTSEQLARLYEKLGEIHALVGKYPPAQAYFEQALAQPFSSPALWRAQLCRKISEVQIQEYQHPKALLSLEQAEQELGLPDVQGTLLERQEWIQIQLARSNLYYWDNQADQMDAIIQNILPLVSAEGRPDQRIELLSQQMQARFRHERYRISAETVEIARRRLELTQPLNIPYDTAWAQFLYGFSLLWHGKPRAAREWLVTSLDSAVRMGSSLLQVRNLAYLSISSRQLGDVTTLREESLRLCELSSAIGEYTYQGISQANMGWLAWREGEYPSAEKYCCSANDIWARSGGTMFPWLANWVLLAMAVSRHDLAQAEDLALAQLNPDLFFQPVLEPVAMKLAEALRARQEKNDEGALRLFAQALELIKESGDL